MDKKKKSQINSKHDLPGSRQDPALEKLLQLLTEKHIRYLDLIPRSSLEEKIVHLVLEGYVPWSGMGPVFDQLLEAIQQYNTNELRTVVFGGGSGLSGILGGDTALATWRQAPFDGLKRMFSRLTVAVCVTDDGGSSGKLLRDLGCIAVGDLRRAVLSSITPRGLLNRYSSLNLEQLESVADALQHILNYRFSRTPNRRFLKAPSTVLSQKLRRSVPDSLLEYLDKTGAAFLEDPLLKDIQLEEQCLGNLLLVSSIYSQRKGEKQKDPPRRFTPTHLQIMKGIQDFACRIGAGPDTIFPAYTTQGELQVLYQHGVLSSGEAKSARKHCSFPVDRVWVHFVRKPQVSSELLKKIEEADLIICAPGSLYTSIIPIFQVPAITEAVRNNRRAVKILGANFWAQRGETDISVRLRGKEFYVSDIIEAYNNNIAGGAAGLFETIIVTDLQSIPGDILRNYALEGKVPIYLDKQRVREMGIEPVEAAVFSEQKLRNEKVIQHDPVKFARTVKALYYLRRHIKKYLPAPSLPPSPFVHGTQFPRKGFLSDHWAAIHRRVQQLDSAHPKLRKVLLDVLWDNREILLEHLSFIRGIKKVRRQHWTRSTEWDNILGYYETEGRCLMIHEDLLKGPEHRLREDLLIALGESLLGNYCLSKSVHEIWEEGAIKGKEFAIDLRPIKKRRIFLNDSDLREYLSLAQLSPGVQNPDRFRMLINGNEAFTPPGLLFGLLYSWYVNNRFGGIINYEASLLRWKINELIPKPSMERVRMQKRIDFFRNVVFRQGIPMSSHLPV